MVDLYPACGDIFRCFGAGSVHHGGQHRIGTQSRNGGFVQFPFGAGQQAGRQFGAGFHMHGAMPGTCKVYGDELRFIRQHHRIKHSGIVGVLQKVTDAGAVQT